MSAANLRRAVDARRRARYSRLRNAGPHRILVVGHGPTLEQDDGAAALLRQLGAEVRAVDLWDDLGLALDREDVLVRALVF